jgi:hypothetical protein
MADFEIESDGDEFEESYSFDAGRRTVPRAGSVSGYVAPKSNFGGYSSLTAEDDVYNFDFDGGVVPEKSQFRSPIESPDLTQRKVPEKPKQNVVAASSESAMEKAQRILQGAKGGGKPKPTIKVKEFDEDEISLDSNDSKGDIGFIEPPLRRSPKSTFKKEGTISAMI